MPSAPRVLLVTDSPDEREMYAEALRRKGFCTLQACSAADAVRMAAELPPAAVVTDLRLVGGEDGLELTRLLKEDADLRGVPVVLLTANSPVRDREGATRAGCDLLVAKPCLPDVLSQLVSGLIERRSAPPQHA